MIVEDFVQRDEAWLAAHLGIPTASQFGRILTPATAKLSDQSKVYQLELLAEWLSGKHEETYKGSWMERGIELESKARQYYELQNDCEVRQVGFIYRDEDRLTGCSPDGLVDGGGYEVKCPKASTHIKSLIEHRLPLQYLPQVQGSLFITGLEFWDWHSFHPDMPSVIIRVYRDETWIRKLESALDAFIGEMLERRVELIARGLKL